MKTVHDIVPTAAEIKVAILNAFENSRPPASVEYLANICSDGTGRAIGGGEGRRVEHWKDFDVPAIQAMDIGWYALNLEEQHYFLPAYLIAMLDEKTAAGLVGWAASFSVEQKLCGDPKWDAKVRTENEAFRNQLGETRINALRMVFRYWKEVGLIDDKQYNEYIGLYKTRRET